MDKHNVRVCDLEVGTEFVGGGILTDKISDDEGKYELWVDDQRVSEKVSASAWAVVYK